MGALFGRGGAADIPGRARCYPDVFKFGGSSHMERLEASRPVTLPFYSLTGWSFQAELKR